MQAEPRTRRRSTWVRAVTVVGVLVLFCGVFAAWPFLFPTSDEPFYDGPIVALGGNPARVATAAELAAATTPPREVVLLADAIDAGEELGLACDPPRVHCVYPDPVNTFGEAILVDEMAGERGWDRVTVVTDPFHLTRSRLLFDRCLDVPVRLVASDTDDPFPTGRLFRAARELASAAASFVVQRGC
jgi:uncharacterized SAM-binding protein YcdF (DUF218 family)